MPGCRTSGPSSCSIDPSIRELLSDSAPESARIPSSVGGPAPAPGRTSSSAVRPAPEPGRIAFVRQRRWLVEEVAEPGGEGEATLVHLSCLDDDAQGQPLAVLWEVACPPSMLEQWRDEMEARFFFYRQRPEDRVLKVLVEKAERIRAEHRALRQRQRTALLAD